MKKQFRKRVLMIERIEKPIITLLSQKKVKENLGYRPMITLKITLDKKRRAILSLIPW